MNWISLLTTYHKIFEFLNDFLKSCGQQINLRGGSGSGIKPKRLGTIMIDDRCKQGYLCLSKK